MKKKPTKLSVTGVLAIVGVLAILYLLWSSNTGNNVQIAQPANQTPLCTSRDCKATDGTVVASDQGWMVVTFEGKTDAGNLYQVAMTNRPGMPTYYILLKNQLENTAVKTEPRATLFDPNEGSPLLGWLIMVLWTGGCVAGWFFTNRYNLEQQREIVVERMETSDGFEIPSATYQLTVIPTLESLEGLLRFISGQSMKLIKGYVKTWSLAEFKKVGSKEVIEKIGPVCATANPTTMKWQTHERSLGVKFVSIKLETYDRDEQTERAGQAAANGESIGREVAGAMKTGGFTDPSQAADAVAKVETARGLSGLGNGIKVHLITGNKEENA